MKKLLMISVLFLSYSTCIPFGWTNQENKKFEFNWFEGCNLIVVFKDGTPFSGECGHVLRKVLEYSKKKLITQSHNESEIAVVTVHRSIHTEGQPEEHFLKFKDTIEFVQNIIQLDKSKDA